MKTGEETEAKIKRKKKNNDNKNTNNNQVKYPRLIMDKIGVLKGVTLHLGTSA